MFDTITRMNLMWIISKKHEVRTYKIMIFLNIEIIQEICVELCFNVIDYILCVLMINILTHCLLLPNKCF